MMAPACAHQLGVILTPARGLPIVQ